MNVGPGSASTVPGLSPEEAVCLQQVSSLALAPDHSMVAVTVRGSDIDTDQNTSAIWAVPITGEEAPAPISLPQEVASTPVWSPSGSLLAYVARVVGDGLQGATRGSWCVRTWEPEGGSRTTLAVRSSAISNLAWSPDAGQIAFEARLDPDAPPDGSALEPMTARTLALSLDGEGSVAARPRAVHLVSVVGGTSVRTLTDADVDLGEPVWSVDGTSLYVSGAVHADRDVRPRTSLFRLAAVGADEESARPPEPGYPGGDAVAGHELAPSLSPDGTRLAFLGTSDHETEPRNARVGVVDLATGRRRWVSEPLDRNFAPHRATRAPCWLDDGHLAVSVEDRGDVPLLVLDTQAPGRPTALTGPGFVTTAFDAAPGVVVLAGSSASQPLVLHRLAWPGSGAGSDEVANLLRGQQIHAPPATPSLRSSTDGQRSQRGATGPVDWVPERVTISTRDGRYDLDAWLLLPPTRPPGASLPVLLNVHGGPFGQYTNAYNEEFRVQATAGFAVLWCNPRGSSGRDEEFARAICGPALGGTGWGSVDFDDVLTVLDAALEQHRELDPQRVGVLGGSYGGYLSAWCLAHSNRFAAGCVERAGTNLAAAEWARDLPGGLRHSFGVSHLEDPDLYQRMSPISAVHRIGAPVLLLTAEHDLRVPPLLAHELFVALRLLDKPVEMVCFPGENHGLPHSGSPRHRVQRLRAICDFFTRHLG